MHESSKTPGSAPVRCNARLAGKKYHFIGAGGIGMSGLAKILLKNGAYVSGSDMDGGFVINRLNRLGADIKIGHWEKWIERLGDDVEAVVISAAVKDGNPELAYAKEKGLRIYKYAQMLGRLMDRYRGIAVAGTHGKSTTTGWLAYVMEKASAKPSYIVGADVPQLEGSSGVGEGQFFVAESCEYDRSFLNLHPEIAVVLNVDLDHLDYYRDVNDIIDAFSDFAAGVNPGGTVIANLDDKNFTALREQFVQKLGPSQKNIKWVTFSLENSNADYTTQNIKLADGVYEFDVCFKGYNVGRVKLGLPGRHNIYNALAVVAAASAAGIETGKIISALSGFTGVDRRLMVKAEIGGVKVLDDYAHHPAEIRASLEAIRQRYKPKRLFCVFQPHQYSRTRFMLDDFAQSFMLADTTIVPEIYFVRDTEQSRREVNAQILVDRIKQKGCDAVFIDSFAGICDYLKDTLDSGDVVVTMGAGDIWKVADEYIQWLRRDS